MQLHPSSHHLRVHRLLPAVGTVSVATPLLRRPPISLIETNTQLVFSLACHFVFRFSALPLSFYRIDFLLIPGFTSLSTCIPPIVSLACSLTLVHRRYNLIHILFHSWLIISREPGSIGVPVHILAHSAGQLYQGHIAIYTVALSSVQIRVCDWSG